MLHLGRSRSTDQRRERVPELAFVIRELDNLMHLSYSFLPSNKARRGQHNRLRRVIQNLPLIRQIEGASASLSSFKGLVPSKE